MRGLLIGRFQPFHKGHLLLIKKILKEIDELSIGIGSSQHLNTKENPFSAEERMDMISRTLEEEGIKCGIYELPDINNDDLYPEHVMGLVPHFDIIYSGNSLVQRLFRDAGKKVKEIELIEGSVFSGTEIRRRMLHDEEWKDLVPTKVYNVLLEINGVKRVKDTARQEDQH